jgi:hypothetical protein
MKQRRSDYISTAVGPTHSNNVQQNTTVVGVQYKDINLATYIYPKLENNNSFWNFGKK